MKKLLSVLAAVMMLSFVSVLAVRAAETPADVFAYSRVQVVNAAGQTVEGISIDGFRGAGQRDIVIPSQIENLPVLKIGYRAFDESYILNSAVLPEGLLEIDPYAFHECEVLRDVNIPRVHHPPGPDRSRTGGLQRLRFARLGRYSRQGDPD